MARQSPVVDKFERFIATHVIGKTFVVARKVKTASGSIWLYEDRFGTNVSPGKRGCAPVTICEHLERTQGTLRLSLDEMTMCLRARFEGSRHVSLGPVTAVWKGGNEFMFSRTEEGSDIRRTVTMPDFFDVSSVRESSPWGTVVTDESDDDDELLAGLLVPEVPEVHEVPEVPVVTGGSE